MLFPRELLKAYGHKATKALGQHFLTDVDVITTIAHAAALKPDEVALEIGPGPGVLTCALLDSGATIVGVEKDRRAAEFLSQRLPDLLPGDQGQRLHIIQADALRVPLGPSLEPHGPGPYVAVGNLPYNVGTAILLRLLEDATPFSRWIFMFQREVAQRLVAKEGSRKYGSLSLAVQSRVHARLILDIPPGAFSPPPKVHSSVVLFETPTEPLLDPELRRAFDKVVRAAFSARRKTLRNALKGGLGLPDTQTLDALLQSAQITPTVRPEKLSMAQFKALATAYKALQPPSA